MDGPAVHPAAMSWATLPVYFSTVADTSAADRLCFHNLEHGPMKNLHLHRLRQRHGLGRDGAKSPK